MASWDDVKASLSLSSQIYLCIKVEFPGSWRSDLSNIAKNLGISVNDIITANQDMFASGKTFVQNGREYIPIVIPSNGTSPDPDPGPTPDPGGTYPFTLANNVCPLPSGSYSISQNFGDGGHGGTDMAAANGTDIMAVQGGTVSRVQAWDGTTSGNQSWGNMIGIYHGLTDGVPFYTLYAHMNAAPTLTVGQSVGRGQVIGHVGNTGYVLGATGNHLHIEVWRGGNSTSYRVNPAQYVPI